MKATSNKAWTFFVQPHLGKSGFMDIFFSPIWANLGLWTFFSAPSGQIWRNLGLWIIFFQPHLGKSGFRAKKI
jgi:hypothetical protein